jgi:2-dehydro-3-deoxygluconokinase
MLSSSAGSPLRIACVGEAMIELSIDIDASGAGEALSAGIGFAGDTLNTAIYLQRALDDHSRVTYVSVLGADPFSARMRAFIEAQGVSTRHIGSSPDRLPGIYAISIDPKGERSFHYWRENSAARTLFQPGSGTSLDELDSFDVVYFSAITLAILPPQMRAMFLDRLALWRRKDGRRVAFDSNYRPRLWSSTADAREWISRAWSLTDIALPSVDDEMALFGDKDEARTIARLAVTCPGIGALKRGSQGPLALGESAPPQRFALVETVVDTTAAGDSFNGGFLGAVLRGKPMATSLRQGHAFASAVIQHRGAIIPPEAMPSLVD